MVRNNPFGHPNTSGKGSKIPSTWLHPAAVELNMCWCCGKPLNWTSSRFQTYSHRDVSYESSLTPSCSVLLPLTCRTFRSRGIRSCLISRLSLSLSLSLSISLSSSRSSPALLRLIPFASICAFERCSTEHSCINYETSGGTKQTGGVPSIFKRFHICYDK